MKNKVVLVIVLLTLVFIFASQNLMAAGKDLEGVWIGELSGLRLVFHVKFTEDGTYEASMDSPDQGVTGIPVTEVILDGKQVKFEIKSIMGTFEGEWDSGSDKIEGVWSQNAFKLPLVLERKESEEGLSNRPQEPQPPYPYKEIEVAYQNEVDGIKLAGTLTIPQGEGPFPAVLLITGSGSQDRDETIMGHKPFKVIADYLTRRGIAVLRVDDRGVGGSTGNPATATSADLAKDVLAGVEFLKTRPDVDQEKIGLIGHSEGGIIAPMVAAQSEDVAFIVLMAGPGLPGDEIIMYQLEAIARVSGNTEEDTAASLQLQRDLMDIVINVEDNELAKAKLQSILEEAIAEMSASEQELIVSAYGSLEQYCEQTINTLLLPWYRFFISYDPRPTLQQVQCPVLAINGSLDLQVDAETNLSAIAEALKQGGNEKVTVKEFPGLNHLFQHSETGNPAEYGQIEETISPEVLEFMTSWILEQSK